MWLWPNDVTPSWGGVPHGTLWTRFTCCPILMFLASLWLETCRFSNWSYCWLRAVQIDIHFFEFGQVKIALLVLYSSQLFYWVWVRKAAKTNPNPLCLIENSQTTHEIWHKSFSMIHLAGSKNWVPQSINRLQRFSLFFL